MYMGGKLKGVFTILDRLLSFHVASHGESPARAASALVLHWGDGIEAPPVMLLKKGKVMYWVWWSRRPALPWEGQHQESQQPASAHRGRPVASSSRGGSA